MKIVVGQGSCGIATGAKKTATEIERQIVEKNLQMDSSKDRKSVV